MQFEELKELLARNRSYRRFDQSNKIAFTLLEDITGLATLCASGRNLQPLKYRIVNNEAECEKIFKQLGWAGYLKDWDGPAEGERPVAYIVQCLDTSLTTNPMCDEGLQLEAITLGAVSKGLGTCIIKSFNTEELKRILDLPNHLIPTHVVACGIPIETVKIEPIADNDIKYWRDSEGVHHVPKRGVQEILVK